MMGPLFLLAVVILFFILVVEVGIIPSIIVFGVILGGFSIFMNWNETNIQKMYKENDRKNYSPELFKKIWEE